MIGAFLDDICDQDMIVPRRMAEHLRVPMSQLAKLAHVNRNTMTASSDSPTIQAKLGEIARIIARAADLTDDEGRAIVWFKHQPILGFGKTAEKLVEAGQACAVLDDLEHMAAGVYS